MTALLRCRICGLTGPKVTPGIFHKRDGTYVTIPRCSDHVACDSRKKAI